MKKAPFVPVKIVNVLLANKGWLRGWREIARNDNLLELIAERRALTIAGKYSIHKLAIASIIIEG